MLLNLLSLQLSEHTPEHSIATATDCAFTALEAKQPNFRHSKTLLAAKLSSGETHVNQLKVHPRIFLLRSNHAIVGHLERSTQLLLSAYFQICRVDDHIANDQGVPS